MARPLPAAARDRAHRRARVGGARRAAPRGARRRARRAGARPRTAAQRDELTLAWHRLDPWPDTVAGPHAAEGALRDRAVLQRPHRPVGQPRPPRRPAVGRDPRRRDRPRLQARPARLPRERRRARARAGRGDDGRRPRQRPRGGGGLRAADGVLVPARPTGRATSTPLAGPTWRSRISKRSPTPSRASRSPPSRLRRSSPRARVTVSARYDASWVPGAPCDRRRSARAAGRNGSEIEPPPTVTVCLVGTWTHQSAFESATLTAMRWPALTIQSADHRSSADRARAAHQVALARDQRAGAAGVEVVDVEHEVGVGQRRA